MQRSSLTQLALQTSGASSQCASPPRPSAYATRASPARRCIEKTRSGPAENLDSQPALSGVRAIRAHASAPWVPAAATAGAVCSGTLELPVSIGTPVAPRAFHAERSSRALARSPNGDRAKRPQSAATRPAVVALPNRRNLRAFRRPAFETRAQTHGLAQIHQGVSSRTTVSVSAFKPQIECLGVVAVCDPGRSREQAPLLLAPLVLRRLNPARFPVMKVEMNHG